MIDIGKEILVAIFFAGIYLFIFMLGEIVKRRIPSNPEIARKSVHLLGGITALVFPYYIASHWTVLALSASFCLIILVTKSKGLLQSVHGVGRVSYGGLYYPIAIYLIFFLASQAPVIYSISILVMAVSDTMAALVGGKYGIFKFDVEGNIKSLEGSIAFLFVTFLCVHLPLLLFTTIGKVEGVLISLIIAILVTGFEVISISGSDNIIVPFGTYFILSKMTRLPLEAIIENMWVLMLISALTAFLMLKPRILRSSGLIAMMLLNYGAMSLCNFYWLLPLLLAEIMYYLFIRIFIYYESVEKVASFQVKVIFYLALIPTALLFTANTIPDHMSLYLPYLASITGQLAIISNYFFSKYLSRPLKAESFFKRHRRVLEVVCTLAATLFVAACPLLVYKRSYPLISLLIVVAGTWVAYTLNFMMNRYYRGVKDDIFEYRRRFVSAGLGVACVFILQKYVLYR